MAAVLLAGCSASVNKSIEQAVTSVTQSREQGEADRNGDRFIFREADPETSVHDAPAHGLPGGFPADFPADFYRPDDFRLQGVMDRGDRHGALRLARLRTAGDPRALGDDARRAMVERGWRLVMARQHGDANRVLAFTKGGRTAVLVFDGTGSRDGSEVQVDLQWRAKRQ